MPRPRTALFAIVLFLLLLPPSAVLNMRIADQKLFATPPGYPEKQFKYATTSPSSADPVRWPTITDDMLPALVDQSGEPLGEPTRWTLTAEPTEQWLSIQWIDNYSVIHPGGNKHRATLTEHRVGYPFTVRSTIDIDLKMGNRSMMIWPIKDGGFTDSAETHHLLGLIVNPILFAIPPWIVLMAVLSLLLLTHRRLRARRRRARGLCPHCAYDLSATQTLPTCPECGTAV